MAGQKNIRWGELRVGLLVLVSIGVLIMLIFAVSGDLSFFKSRTTYRTRLAGAEGLKKGDEVRLAGVRVGSVTSVDFDAIPQDLSATSAVIVSMEVDGDIAKERIREDSFVILRQVGLLGGQYLDITPGTAQRSPLPEGAFIQGKAQTSIEQVVASSDDLLQGFKKLSNNLNEITDTINSGEGTIGRFVNDEALYVNINKTVLEAQELMRKIRDGEGTAGKLINDPALYNNLTATVNSLKSLSDDLSAGKGTAGKLLKDEELYRNMNSAVAKLNTTADRIDRITAQLEAGKGPLGAFLYDEKLRQDTTDAVASLRSVAARLDKGEGTVGKAFRDEALYNNLNQLSAESVKLLYDFRQNPKKYLSIKVSLF
jgi:phospholipid/cholesterol/gamma-HCH transport system substrate-binding protein